MRGGGALASPFASDESMSGSSGISSFSHWNCELVMATSESEKDMAIVMRPFWLSRECIRLTGSDVAGMGRVVKQSTSSVTALRRVGPQAAG
jgi:hypothetical protein